VALEKFYWCIICGRDDQHKYTIIELDGPIILSLHQSIDRLLHKAIESTLKRAKPCRRLTDDDDDDDRNRGPPTPDDTGSNVRPAVCPAFIRDYRAVLQTR
jgi:hypothetical protein